MADFFEFYHKNNDLLNKIGVAHHLEVGDVPGTAWLSWHEASRSYRASKGAAFETWAIRQFENACRRYAAQRRFGVELDDTDSDDLRLSISDEEAIFSVLEPEPEQALDLPRSGGGVLGEITRAAAEGLTIAEIAIRVRRTPRRVNQIFAKMRPDPNPPYQQMTLFDLAL